MSTTTTTTTTTPLCTSFPLAGATLLDGFCAGELPVAVRQARSIVAVGATDFLVLERGTGSVLAGEDLLGGDGVPESVRTLVTVDGLNHGLAVTGAHLYASTPTEVYRWPYDPTNRTIRTSNDAGDGDVAVGAAAAELVIENMNADGNGGAPFGHTTRTLVVDEATNRLYVSVGSSENVDPDSFRARIRVFALNDPGLFPLDFLTGAVFADGLRNEVALALRPHDNVLWGAGNSADKLARDDLGGAGIFNDNPAEGVHRFDPAGGQNYGYPYCWREYALGDGYGRGRGTAWAWPTFLEAGTVTDQQCRDGYDAPVLALQAHSAPLGVAFYRYRARRPSPACDGVLPFPAAMDGDAFLALHGSWNRDVPTGYKVVHVPVTGDGRGVVGGIGADPVDLLKSASDDGVRIDGAKWDDGFRPVGVSFDACGRLLVSSDGSRSSSNSGVYRGSKIVRIERTIAEDDETPTPSPSNSLAPAKGSAGTEDDPTPSPSNSLAPAKGSAGTEDDPTPSPSNSLAPAKGSAGTEDDPTPSPSNSLAPAEGSTGTEDDPTPSPSNSLAPAKGSAGTEDDPTPSPSNSLAPAEGSTVTEDDPTRSPSPSNSLAPAEGNTGTEDDPTRSPSPSSSLAPAERSTGTEDVAPSVSHSGATSEVAPLRGDDLFWVLYRLLYIALAFLLGLFLL